MVQDADYPWQGLVEVKTLHTIPRHLLGIRQTCIWGVVPNFGVSEDNENEVEWLINNAKKIFLKISASSMEISMQIIQG